MHEPHHRDIKSVGALLAPVTIEHAYQPRVRKSVACQYQIWGEAFHKVEELASPPSMSLESLLHATRLGEVQYIVP